MTKQTWTPGPWHVVDRPQRGLQVEWGDGSKERPIAHMRWIDGMRPEVNERVACDARLIALAPEMAETIKAMCAHMRTFRNVPKDEQEWTQSDDDVLDAGFAILAKLESAT